MFLHTTSFLFSQLPRIDSCQYSLPCPYCEEGPTAQITSVNDATCAAKSYQISGSPVHLSSQYTDSYTQVQLNTRLKEIRNIIVKDVMEKYTDFINTIIGFLNIKDKGLLWFKNLKAEGKEQGIYLVLKPGKDYP